MTNPKQKTVHGHDANYREQVAPTVTRHTKQDRDHNELQLPYQCPQPLPQKAGFRLVIAFQLRLAYPYIHVAAHVVDRWQRAILRLYPVGVPLKVTGLVLQSLHFRF